MARRMRARGREVPMIRRAFAAAVVLLLSTAGALACSCGPPNPKRAAAEAEVLFEGSVVDQRIGVDLAGKPAAVIRVQVSRMVRGHRPDSGIVVLYSAPHPAACGVDYRGGFTGRFGARMHTGGLYTSACTQFNLNLDPARR